MPLAYFAAGSTLANMVNLETIVADAFQVLERGRVPSVAPNAQRNLDGVLVRSGKIKSAIQCDVPTDAERIALNTHLFGAQNIAGGKLYMTLLDDENHFNPYYVSADRPVEMNDYQPAAGGVYVTKLVLNLFNCVVQYVSKSASYSMAATERWAKVTTASGDVTVTMLAASAVTANTVYAWTNTDGTNDVILTPDGSDTINGASSYTLSAAGARVQLVSDGVSAWTSVT